MIYKENEEKESAKNEILEEIDKLRQTLKKKKSSKKDINDLVDKIEKDIDTAVQKGCTIIKGKKKINPGYRSISKNVESIDEDMKKYLDKFSQRIKQIKKIQNKMKVDSFKKQNSKKIKSLEKQLMNIEKINTTDINQINRIKKKIFELKKKLN